jgi:uncharacterized metal-binding protein YceD (DUF177 family)
LAANTKTINFALPKIFLMNFRRSFEIAFVGLKPGIHQFDFEVDDLFFSHYGTHDFETCAAKVKVQLDKKPGFFLLHFDIDGWVQTGCDKCGNSLRLQLWEEFKMMVKMVDDPELMNQQGEDPDVFYISRGESHLHMADWIYEFVMLSIPMQRRCSEQDMGGDQCNKDVLAKLASMEKDAGKEVVNTLEKQLEKIKKIDS